MMFPIDYNGDVLNHNARVGVDGGIVESTDFLADFSEQTKRVNMPLLLDIYPNAAAAYSLRKLRTAYTGSAIRVRRSSDNTETNIGFNNAGDLDTSALMAFVGNGDGFVRTWYDQSGNNYHALQTGTTNQPVIVSGGTLITTNSKPSLNFDGAGDTFTATITPLLSYTNMTTFIINNPAAAAAPDATTSVLFGIDQGGASTPLGGLSFGEATDSLTGEKTTMYFSNSSISGGRLGSSTYNNNANEQTLFSIFNLSSGVAAYKNNSFITFDLAAAMTTSTPCAPANTNATNPLFHIGTINGASNGTLQKFQEVIVYPSNQSPNRIGIETNINSYYRIYQQEALLLDYYPDAAAAYSLRKLRSRYTGAAIQVRRSSDNAVQNIGFDSNGGLDTTALTTFVGTGNTGFVTTWYDQSGNNRNATQSTTANQPVIFSGGTVISENNKPSLLWHSSSVSLPLSDLSLTRNINNFYSTAVARNNLNTATSSRWIFLHSVNGADGSRALLGIFTPLVNYRTGGRRLDADAFQGADSSVVDDLSLKLYTSHLNYGGSDAFLWVNNSLVASNTNFLTDGNTADTLSKGSQIGNNNTNVEGWRGTIQELIHYTSNQSTNRPLIEANINSYYNIYVSENDAQSFIDAAAITNSTQRQAINKLVYDLKAYGLWYKMKAIYPFVGGTAASHKFNLKDPRDVDGAFRLVFNGGWTHSATGAKPDGSTGYANTFFNPFIQLGVTNAHQAFYNRMDVSNSIIINGCTSGLNNRFDFGFDSGRLPFHAIGNTNSSVGSAISSTAGFIFSTRTGTSSGFMQRNTTNIISVLPVFTSYASQNYFISARNVSGSATLFSLNEIAYFSLGDGLTDTEAANLYTAVQTFQTTLGRQV